MTIDPFDIGRQPPKRPKMPNPKVTVEFAGRWRYKITLHSGWFTTATWYRFGLERAKRKASYELYKHVKKENLGNLPAVITYQSN